MLMVNIQKIFLDILLYKMENSHCAMCILPRHSSLVQLTLELKYAQKLQYYQRYSDILSIEFIVYNI